MTRRPADGGFTLPELLLVVVITGVIALPLGNMMLGILRNTDDTNARLSESHDIQVSASYLAQDVAAIGVRDTTSSTLALKQSVEVNVASDAGLYPCGSGTTTLLRLAWDDFTTLPDPTTKASATSTLMRVAYVQVGSELHRVTCAGSATPTSDVTIVHNLVSASVSCPSSCTGSGANVPASVTLTVAVRDSRDTGSNVSIDLTGQRRQT